MKILVIEDDENKRNQILHFLQDTFPLAKIEIAKSLQTGLKAIIRVGPDLILLDMTMPTFDIGGPEDGGRPQPLGGREILRQMARRKITVPTIVVTQFDKFGEGAHALTIEELHSQLRSAHTGTYVGFVYYNAALEGWKQELGSLIGSVGTSS